MVRIFLLLPFLLFGFGHFLATNFFGFVVTLTFFKSVHMHVLFQAWFPCYYAHPQPPPTPLPPGPGPVVGVLALQFVDLIGSIESSIDVVPFFDLSGLMAFFIGMGPHRPIPTTGRDIQE
jgi:hypothetical protein